MSQPSFKSLSSAGGPLKKADLFRAKLDDLLVEEGFNYRDASRPDVVEHIEQLTAAILRGDVLPPLRVRVGQSGELIIVDGHCRRQAYLNARERGAPIEWIDLLPFRGNDVDRVAEVIKSSQGLALTPLEVATGYARLISYNLSADEIAAKFGRTRQHVDSLLILARANSDVQQLVREGAVSATTAIEAVRKHGEGAGEVLRAAVGTAATAGKKRATPAMVRGKSLPRKAWEPMVRAVDAAVEALPPVTRQTIANAIETPEKYQGITVPIQVSLLASLLAVHGQVQDVRAKQEAKNTHTAPGGAVTRQESK